MNAVVLFLYVVVMLCEWLTITTLKFLPFTSMAENKSSKTLSIYKIVPADSPTQFALPLTFFDKLWLQLKPSSRVFFYKLPESNTYFFHSILPNLKHSLSLALNHYLPLAGNLIWPHDSKIPIANYNSGDGVSLTVAEAQADFDYLSGDVFRQSAELHSLLPDFPSSETLIPAMALQITLFPKRGFSIAYVVHHAIVDGKSISLFMNSWAYICKKGGISVVLPPELTPSFDRTFVEHHKELEKVYPKGFGPIDPKSRSLPTFDMTPPPIMLGTFKLTRENIEALKNEVKTSHIRVSTFTVTVAYVVICLTRAKKVTADKTCIRVGVDCRLRLDPPLPPTYFGNCLAGSEGYRDTDDFLAEDGFAVATSAVSDALENLNEGILKLVEKQIASPVTKSIQVFNIAGSPRFELYKVDFGWGKSIKVDIISIGGGEIGSRTFSPFVLSDDRDDNGGIEIGIALGKHEAESFASIFASGLETR